MNADPRDYPADMAARNADLTARREADWQQHQRELALAKAQQGLRSPAPAAPPDNADAYRPNEVQRGHVLHDEGLDFLGGERDARDFLRANRHSGRVRFLRITLPLVALFILTVVVGAYFWSATGAPDVTIQSASMEDGRMVMSNPKIDGVDDRQRPYTLAARQAIQNPADLGKVELDGIDANIPMEEGLYAKILAGRGFYDADAKTLKLQGNVDITTDDGMNMTMQDADVDMDAGSLKTANPVAIQTEQAEISAMSFTVENNGEKVIFENRVRMTIFPGKFAREDDVAATGTSN